jgi:hypothetical protein
LRDRPRRLLLVSVRTTFRTDNRRTALRGLGTLVQERIPHGPQPAVICPQGLHEGVEGVVLAPVPVELGAQLGEAVVPCLSPTLQLL